MSKGQEGFNPQRRRVTARGMLVGVGLAAFLYVGSFLLNSSRGGYWAKLERDGRDRWSFGLSMHTAVLWQPRFGYCSRYRSDWIGAFYLPLIVLDRKWVHPTRYVSDPEYFGWANATIVADWHPRFHDEFHATRNEKPK